MFNSSKRGGGGLPRSCTGNVGKISKDLDRPSRDVNDAIHAVKNRGGWRGFGANKNPDVVVDTSSGEAYPKLPDGTVSDESIGNLYDYLEDPD